jgi:hypothetical protein
MIKAHKIRLHPTPEQANSSSVPDKQGGQRNQIRDTPLGREVQRLLHSYPCRRFLALTNELRRYAADTVCLWRVPSPQLRGGPQIPHDTSAGCCTLPPRRDAR